MRRVALLIALAAGLVLPASAGAAVTCEFNSGAEVLSVTMDAEFDAAELEVNSGSNIYVRSHGPIVACTGGQSTISNTEYVNVIASKSFDELSIFRASEFAATTTLLLAFADATDDISPSGGPGADHFILGEGGIDTDADGNADVIYPISKPQEIEVAGLGGADTIAARGGPSVGTAVSSSRLRLSGGDTGGDTLEGGEKGDSIESGVGPDLVRGFGGEDAIVSHGAGEHSFDGGAGTDTIGYPFAKGVTVDLGETGPQDTGQGEDTIFGIENVEGTEFDDTLTGDGGPNRLNGSTGDDTFDGRGGDDMLEGSIGTDTVTYAKAPAPVTVDLGAGSASGGAGKDTLSGVENLVGSPFADVLTGSDVANRIDPRGGPDLVKALGGEDLVEARDAFADNVSCGAGKDHAIADRLSLDTIQPDCELVDPLAEAETKVAGLDFRLTGARRQRLLKQKAAIVKVSCPEEECSVVAGGSDKAPKLKLKRVTKRLAPGPASVLKLRLKPKQRRKIAARLARGKGSKLKIVVTASDAAGRQVRRSLVVSAKR